MTKGLHLSPRHREEIEALLHKHLPGVEAWAYGSRVNGRSHDGSDLDLVLRGPKLAEIGTSRFADFIEALQDSTIPFLVEVRDWARLPESFHCEIEREHVVLMAAKTPTERVRELDYVLTPGWHVGLPDDEDDFDFNERFTKLKAKFEEQLKEEEKLNALILENLKKVKVNG